MKRERKTLQDANPELAKQWHPTKNGDLTPADVAPGAGRKAWWLCPKGHEWEAVINSRNRGRGCPVCSGDLVSRGHNDLATTHPELAKEWDGDPHGDVTPFTVSAGSRKKLPWKCEHGHTWNATVSNRTIGRGCPYCSGQKVWTGFNDLASQCPELASMWDFEKNKGPGPTEVNVGTPNKAHWKCKNGHSWSEPVRSAVKRKAKCQECARTLPGELAEQWDELLNGGPPPADLLASSKRKAWWKCPEGHSWEATVTTRSRGRGCVYCTGVEVLPGFNDLFTKVPHLQDEWDKEANEGLDPRYVSAGSGKKAHWVCERGHKWTAVIHSRAKGARCAACLEEDRLKAKQLREAARAEERRRKVRQTASGETIRLAKPGGSLHHAFPTIAEEWHPSKNGGVTPMHVTPTSTATFWWKCRQGHEWEADPAWRVQVQKCPYCAGSKRVPVRKGWNDFASRHPEAAVEWHPTKNGARTAENTRFNDTKPVWWVCPEGHGYERSPADRARGRSCPYCTNKRVLPGHNDLATIAPEVAGTWDYVKNDDTPQDVVSGSHAKRYWLCEKGHSWEAPVKDRVRGTGCPYCANVTLLVGYNDLATTHPDLVKDWDEGRNGDLTPTDLFAYSSTPVHWKCHKCEYRWRTKPAHRAAGSDCPGCGEQPQTSKAEGRLRDWLAESGVIVDIVQRENAVLRIPWRTRTWMQVDILGQLADTGLPAVVEYDGLQWHNNDDSFERDTQKTTALLDAGYLVARVRENDLAHLDLEHPNLLQLNCFWSYDDDATVDAAHAIEAWLFEHLPAGHPLRPGSAAA